MPVRQPTPPQKRGTEFGGVSQQNTVQPVKNFSDLKPSDQARLIKTTGQTESSTAKASRRAWHGQKP